MAPWSRSRSRLKKKPGAGAGAGWEKNQEPEPEPLEKKVRSRSRKKICRLPSPGFFHSLINDYLLFVAATWGCFLDVQVYDYLIYIMNI